MPCRCMRDSPSFIPCVVVRPIGGGFICCTEGVDSTKAYVWSFGISFWRTELVRPVLVPAVGCRDTVRALSRGSFSANEDSKHQKREERRRLIQNGRRSEIEEHCNVNTPVWMRERETEGDRPVRSRGMITVWEAILTKIRKESIGKNLWPCLILFVLSTDGKQSLDQLIHSHVGWHMLPNRSIERHRFRRQSTDDRNSDINR